MEDPWKMVLDVGGPIASVLLGGGVATWRASKEVANLKAQIAALSTRLDKLETDAKRRDDELEKDLERHIEIDDQHHKEDQDQWKLNNRELGEIHGMLGGLSPRGRMKSRP